MSRGRNNRWTAVEDERLRALLAQGMNDRQCGRAMERHVETVRRKRQALGIQPYAPRRLGLPAARTPEYRYFRKLIEVFGLERARREYRR